MIGELLSIQGASGSFLLSLVVFGLAPGFVLAGIVRLIPDEDRRRELQANLYDVPRWEQPYWVAQQLEVAIRVGVFPNIVWYWERWVWHRAKIKPGIESNREHPDSFWVPSADEKAELRPGDLVKLMWLVKRDAGERMWVRVTHRDGSRLVGSLENWPLFVRMDPGEKIKFHVDDIMDYMLEDEDAEAA